MNVKGKTIKLIVENISVYLRYIGLGNGFLHMTQKGQTTKEKIGKLGTIKIKTLKKN